VSHRLASALKRLFAVVFGVIALSPASAAAQARLEPAEAPSGGDVELTLWVGSACGAGGLAAARLEIPEGLLRVRPQAAEGWRMTVQDGALAYIYNFRGALISSGVKEIEWRAQTPVAGEVAFEARASLAPLPAGERLTFAADLICADGTKQAAAGEALTLTVTAPRGGRL
jgi:uncharacterized protein YcnI